MGNCIHDFIQEMSVRKICTQCGKSEIEILRKEHADSLAKATAAAMSYNQLAGQFAAMVVKSSELDKYPEILEVTEELVRAISLHGPIRSPHEGYAVIAEELDELWTEVKKKCPDPDLIRMEAKQIAAMGIRFMIDICRSQKGAKSC